MKNNGKTDAKVGLSILCEIEAEFERLAPGFAKLPPDKRSKYILKVLRDVQNEMSAENALPTFTSDDYVYAFDEDFPREPNTLYATKDKRLFLAYLEKGKINDLEEVSLVEALEWYCRVEPFSTGGSGTVELLCGMAAKKSKEIA